MSGPRVTFVTDAGGEAGLGHFKRCAALGRALGARSIVVDALVCGPSTASLTAVAPDLPVTPLDWWGAPRRVLDAVAGRAVDAFVVDSYHADAHLLAALRGAALVVAIDDLADRPLPADVVVNGAWYAERLAYRLEPGTVCLLGPRHALLDRAFAEAPLRTTAASVTRVLVTLGGATPAVDTAAAVSAVRSALPGARLDVLGGLVPLAAAPGPEVTLHGAVPSLRPLLVAADLADRPLPADVVVNGAWHAERLAYRVEPGTVCLLGPRHALLDRAFAEAPLRTTAASVTRVLVTLGGATPAVDTAAAVSAVRSALPGARLDVLGGLVPLAAAPGPEVTLHGAVPSLRPLLVAADLAVTAGGMTLYECLATGTPAVAVCLADNQRANLEHLGAAGLVIPADFSTLGAAVGRVAADRALRERLAAAGRRAIDGRGAERVADAIAQRLAARTPARSA